MIKDFFIMCVVSALLAMGSTSLFAKVTIGEESVFLILAFKILKKNRRFNMGKEREFP